MPRTKKLHKETLKAKDIKILTDFKRKSAIELKKLKSDLEMKMMQALDNMDIQFHKIPIDIQTMTLGELFQRIESQSDDEETSRDSLSFKERLRRHTNAASDDGYSSDKPQLYKSKLIMSCSKSSERSKILSSLKHTSKKTQSIVYAHTPANRRPIKVEPITPKVCLNTAVNLLRKPRNGETVFSMSGSPLMVTTSVLEDDQANLIVPLNNGDVISLLPTGDLRQSLLPTISPRTREQLRKLKNHIEKFIS